MQVFLKGLAFLIFSRPSPFLAIKKRPHFQLLFEYLAEEMSRKVSVR